MANRSAIIRTAKNILKSRGYSRATVRVNYLNQINVNAIREEEIVKVAEVLADDTMYFINPSTLITGN